MSNYFSFLPDVYVRTATYRTNNVDPYVLAKNIFRRIKIRDDVEYLLTGFTQYTIKNQERPDQISDEFYGDPQFDWVVLLTNNVVNLYQDWPMAEDELYRHCERKYGANSVNATHHWETQEQRGPKNIVQLPGGVQVPQDFRYTRPDGTAVELDKLVKEVTNFEHELAQNEFKRNIYLLRKPYLKMNSLSWLNTKKTWNWTKRLDTRGPEMQSKKTSFQSNPLIQQMWVGHLLSVLLLKQIMEISLATTKVHKSQQAMYWQMEAQW